jgi:hypothetical protein
MRGITPVVTSLSADGGKSEHPGNRADRTAHGDSCRLRQSAAENLSAVIPGRREAAGPESRHIWIPAFLDSGLAPSARPGMTNADTSLDRDLRADQIARAFKPRRERS